MAMAVKRIMSGLRLDVAKVDENGFLKTKAFATRTGVFVYRKADGSEFRELRLPEEVFNEDSMDSLKFVPVTNNHPTERVVNSRNAKKFQVGMTGDVFKEDQYLGANVAITDQETIDEVMNGKQELSCGYMCELEHTSGEWNGERYDAIQRNISYNHLAVVSKGRAGANVKLHLDSEDAIEVNNDAEHGVEKKENEDMKMVKRKLGDGVEIELSEEMADKFDAYMEKMKKDMKKKDAAEEEKADSLQSENERLKAKVDHLREENEGLKAKVDSDEEIQKKINDGVKVRVSLEKKAMPFLKEDADTSEMSDRELKIAVIKTKRDGFDGEGKSDAYIDGAFEALVEEKPESKADSTQEKNPLDFDKRADADKKESAEEIRKRNMKADSERWMKPLSEK